MSQSNDFRSPSLSYEQVQEWLPGYALGALDADEMVAVDAYLQQHEALLQQRYDLELAGQAMAYSAPDRPLPARLKANLMQRVYADAPTTQRRSPFAAAQGLVGEPLTTNQPLLGRQPVSTRTSTARKAKPQPLFPEEQRGGNWFGGLFQGLIGLAAVGATAVLLFANWQLQTSTRQLEAQVALVQQELGSTQNTLQQTQTRLGDTQGTLQQTQTDLTNTQAQVAKTQSDLRLAQTQANEIKADAEQLQLANTSLEEQLTQQGTQIEVLSNANRLLTLAGVGQAQQASGNFFVSNGRAILNLRGLRQLPPEQAYQLWYIPEGGQPVPADLFQVEQGDSTLVTFPIPAQNAAFANIGISIEPASGSQTPTELVMTSAA